MYILNSTVTVEFILPPSASPPAQSTLDVITTAPDGTRTYTNDISTLTSPTYTAPTATAQGKATFDYIVAQKGRYRFTLGTGIEGAYTELSQLEIFVIDSPVVPTISTTLNRKVSVDIGTTPTFSSTLSWYDITCIAPHPTDVNKVVVGGQQTFPLAYGTGVYDLNTDIWSEINMTGWYSSQGVQMTLSSLAVSPSGRYVAIDKNSGIESNHGANTYAVYWTDDASLGWTLGTGFSTAGQGQEWVTYDPISGIWWWALGANKLYSSADGKAWTQETTNIVNLRDYIKGVPAESNRFMMAGIAERIYYTDTAVNTGLPLGANLLKGNSDGAAFSGSNISIMGMTTDGTLLYAMSDTIPHTVITSPSGLTGTWTEHTGTTGLEGETVITKYIYLPSEQIFVVGTTPQTLYYSTNGYNGWTPSTTGFFGTSFQFAVGGINNQQAASSILMPGRGAGKMAWVGYTVANENRIYFN